MKVRITGSNGKPLKQYKAFKTGRHTIHCTIQYIGIQEHIAYVQPCKRTIGHKKSVWRFLSTAHLLGSTKVLTYPLINVSWTTGHRLLGVLYWITLSIVPYMYIVRSGRLVSVVFENIQIRRTQFIDHRVRLTRHSIRWTPQAGSVICIDGGFY